MIKIRDKALCCGCRACSNACPVDAIKFEEDEEGFVYPAIDEDLCVNCNNCNNVCPMLKPGHGIPNSNHHYNISFYAAQLKDKDELRNVSSGGAFWAMAQTVLNKHGVVFGAKQKDVDVVYHVRTEALEEAKNLRRSKYLHSNIGYCYRQAKEDLEKGKTVLFSGTGCQIAGLNSFLRKEYDNLVTCDVVCHGVPSIKVWRKYREEKEKIKKKRIVDLVFRDKSAGWSKNQYMIKYEDGSYEKERSITQLFHTGYLNGLFYRPSCGKCPFASLPRVSDVTLADYWKYEGKLKERGEDIGISLIAVNTKKGEDFLESTRKYLELETTNPDLALSSCKHLDEHPTENPLRSTFIKDTLENGYYYAINKFLIIKHLESAQYRLKRIAARILHELGVS